MHDHRVELATLNNVFWYRAMFQAHQIACTTDDLSWWTDRSPPPFHSNLVVLSPLATYESVRQRLRAIARALPSSRLSMKDSFASFDLSSDGYAILFEASWIWRDPALPSAHGPQGSPSGWTTVTSATELQAWENAWRGDARNGLDAYPSRQFPPSLLASPSHRFFVKVDGQRVVAGAIANRSPGAVGLSNTFSPGPASFDWKGLVQCATEHYPGVPLVGYERGTDLAHAESAGFTALAPLRVWQLASSSEVTRTANDS